MALFSFIINVIFRYLVLGSKGTPLRGGGKRKSNKNRHFPRPYGVSLCTPLPHSPPPLPNFLLRIFMGFSLIPANLRC